MTSLLWRIEGTATTPHLDDWQEGLILHLLFQSLTLILARRENQTRRYLVLEGCPSCRADGCERVCHRMLFEQLVATTLPGVTLIPTPRLVSRVSENRRLLATPTAKAQLLDEGFLAQWEEGQLVTTWSRLRATTRPVTVGAQLTVDTKGPSPAKALEEVGWRALPLASLISRRAQAAEVPQPVRVGARVGEALFKALRDPRTLTGAAPSAPPNMTGITLSCEDQAATIEGETVSAASEEA